MSKKSPAYYVIIYILLMLTQISIFGNMAILGYATPFLFLYFILKLPSALSPNWVMTLSFITGLILDIFFNTLGVYSLACTLTAFLRRPFITLVMQREEEATGIVPSINSLGAAPFTVYALLTIFTFSAALFIIQAFSLFNPGKLILQILSSTLVTYILVYAVERISVK